MFKKVYKYVVKTNGYEFSVMILSSTIIKADELLKQHIKSLKVKDCDFKLHEELCTTSLSGYDRVMCSELMFHQVAKHI